MVTKRFINQAGIFPFMTNAVQPTANQDLFGRILASIPTDGVLAWSYSDGETPFMDFHGGFQLVRERDALKGLLPEFIPYIESIEPQLVLRMPMWLRNHLIPTANGVEDVILQACMQVDQSAFDLAKNIAGKGGYYDLSPESHGFERRGTVYYVLFGPRGFEVMAKPPHDKTFTGRPSLTQVVVVHELKSNSYSDFRSVNCSRFPVKVQHFANDLDTLATKLGGGKLGGNKDTFKPVQDYLSHYAAALRQTVKA